MNTPVPGASQDRLDTISPEPRALLQHALSYLWLKMEYLSCATATRAPSTNQDAHEEVFQSSQEWDSTLPSHPGIFFLVSSTLLPGDEGQTKLRMLIQEPIWFPGSLSRGAWKGLPSESKALPGMGIETRVQGTCPTARLGRG